MIATSNSATSEISTLPSPRSLSTRSASSASPKAAWFTARMASSSAMLSTFSVRMRTSKPAEEEFKDMTVRSRESKFGWENTRLRGVSKLRGVVAQPGFLPGPRHGDGLGLRHSGQRGTRRKNLGVGVRSAWQQIYPQGGSED